LYELYVHLFSTFFSCLQLQQVVSQKRQENATCDTTTTTTTTTEQQLQSSIETQLSSTPTSNQGNMALGIHYDTARDTEINTNASASFFFL
jgi:hypothetical protein